MKVKQIIVINKELGMSPGQVSAQVAHAAMLFLCNRLKFDLCSIPATRMILPGRALADFSENERFWLEESFTKVVVKVKNTTQLLEVYENAKAAGLEAHLMDEEDYIDGFPGKVYTALAVGPAPSNVLKPITGHLRLL